MFCRKEEFYYTTQICFWILLPAEFYHASQASNVTSLEKRSPMMKAKPEFKCHEARYETVSLYDFIYKHYCFPIGWEGFLEDVREEIEQNISPKLLKDAQLFPVEPPMVDVFNAFKVGHNYVRAVILGQDPTPQAGKSTGLAFSLKPGVEPSTVPSVFNMLVELKWEGIQAGLSNGDLTPWLDQGVLLLNSALTVRQGNVAQANSHRAFWKGFTQSLVNYVDKATEPTAWLLWGNEAQTFAQFINKEKHFIKAGAHPRYTTGFYGRNYFRCANEFLQSKNRGQIDWSLLENPGSVATFVEGCKADGLGQR